MLATVKDRSRYNFFNRNIKISFKKRLIKIHLS